MLVVASTTSYLEEFNAFMGLQFLVLGTRDLAETGYNKFTAKLYTSRFHDKVRKQLTIIYFLISHSSTYCIQKWLKL